MTDYNSKDIDSLLSAVLLLGKDKVMDCRKKAMANMTTETIETEAKFLGGKLTIKLEFDGRQ